MNMAGVPVELSVETIFSAILALLPIPVKITLPDDSKIVFTVEIKSSLIEDFSPETAVNSLSIVAIAISFISLLDFINTFFYFFVSINIFYAYICFSGNLLKNLIKIMMNVNQLIITLLFPLNLSPGLTKVLIFKIC